MDQEIDSHVEQQKDTATITTNQGKLKSTSSKSRQSSLDFRKYTKQIWLAGLGAFSRAEEEGNKLFDALVKVGEELASKSELDAETTKIMQKDDKAKAMKSKKEGIFDSGMHHSLNRIGLVTSKDLQYLENMILQLHEKVDSLVLENKLLHEKLDKNNLS